MFDEEPDGDPHGECAEEIKRLTVALKDAIPYLDHNHFYHKLEETESKDYKLSFDAQCVRCRAEVASGLRTT